MAGSRLLLRRFLFVFLSFFLPSFFLPFFFFFLFFERTNERELEDDTGVDAIQGSRCRSNGGTDFRSTKATTKKPRDNAGDISIEACRGRVVVIVEPRSVVDDGLAPILPIDGSQQPGGSAHTRPGGAE